ncbi:VOC family protein [Amycolatopsis nigrescens]|uniref:VOC family protein n=1 Tax=Amycolatopsis nigrescens TaxID=381445 RepID=UPI00037495FB|nr:VOC family protein [Amycolatopsis nigrescens]
MSSRILAIALDAADPDELARFWAAALGLAPLRHWHDARGVRYVEIGEDGKEVLLFQAVPDRKSVKNRMHLDVVPTEGGQYDEVRRLVALGARELSDEPDFPWVVLADPEGNEFCVLPPGS